MNYILAFIAAYLLGSVSIGILLGKSRFKTDVRTQGSGNAGATNVARVFGMNAGLLTFLGDAVKTFLALFAGRLFAGDIGVVVAGIGCLIGHCWPIFFGFKGGKGVTVSAATSLWLDWRLFLILVATFFIVYLICKIVSVCSIAAALMYPLAMFVLGGFPAVYFILAVFVTLYVCYMHRSNIKRIFNGTETRFKPKS